MAFNFTSKGKAKKNQGEECWDKDKCQKTEGDCSYCGSKGKCCRADEVVDYLSGCCAPGSTCSPYGHAHGGQGIGRNGDHTCV